MGLFDTAWFNSDLFPGLEAWIHHPDTAAVLTPPIMRRVKWASMPILQTVVGRILEVRTAGVGTPLRCGMSQAESQGRGQLTSDVSITPAVIVLNSSLMHHDKCRIQQRTL